MPFLELLKRVLLMERSIYRLQKIIQRHTSTTVMALEVAVILDLVDVSPCLVFVLLRVATDRTTKVVEVTLDPLELL